MSQQSSLVFTRDEAQRTSKRLRKLLESDHKLELTASQSQNLFAKALGSSGGWSALRFTEKIPVVKVGGLWDHASLLEPAERLMETIFSHDTYYYDPNSKIVQDVEAALPGASKVSNPQVAALADAVSLVIDRLKEKGLFDVIGDEGPLDDLELAVGQLKANTPKVPSMDSTVETGDLNYLQAIIDKRLGYRDLAGLGLVKCDSCEQLGVSPENIKHNESCLISRIEKSLASSVRDTLNERNLLDLFIRGSHALYSIKSSAARTCKDCGASGASYTGPTHTEDCIVSHIRNHLEPKSQPCQAPEKMAGPPMKTKGSRTARSRCEHPIKARFIPQAIIGGNRIDLDGREQTFNARKAIALCSDIACLVDNDDTTDVLAPNELLESLGKHETYCIRGVEEELCELVDLDYVGARLPLQSLPTEHEARLKRFLASDDLHHFIRIDVNFFLENGATIVQDGHYNKITGLVHFYPVDEDVDDISFTYNGLELEYAYNSQNDQFHVKDEYIEIVHQITYA